MQKRVTLHVFVYIGIWSWYFHFFFVFIFNGQKKTPNFFFSLSFVPIIRVMNNNGSNANWIASISSFTNIHDTQRLTHSQFCTHIIEYVFRLLLYSLYYENNICFFFRFYTLSVFTLSLSAWASSISKYSEYVPTRVTGEGVGIKPNDSQKAYAHITVVYTFFHNALFNRAYKGGK